MKNSELKYGVYLSYISLFVTNITSLILTPFIVRNLGQSEYGLYMLIGALVGYIAVLDFGLGNTTVRFVSKYRAENDKKGQENFLATTFIIYAVISIIVLIIGYIVFVNLGNIFSGSLTENEIGIAKTMFIILVINLALTLPMKSFTGIVTAYEKFVFTRSLNIVRTILRTVIVLILLSLGYKAIAIVLIDALLNVTMMLLTMLYVFLKLKVKIKLYKFNKSLFQQILSYSSLIFISVIVDQIYWRIGHLVLGIVASTTEIAVFAIGMIFGQYFITFATAISGVFLPRITTMVVKEASNIELTNIMTRTGRIQLLVLGFILGGFILYGKRFIYLWLGPGYDTSWIIALTVMIPLIVVLTQTIGISILQAKNMHGFRAIMYLCISVVNLIVSIYLAGIFGGIGAAIGTSLSLVLGNIIVMNLYYHFKVKLNIPLFFRSLSKKIVTSLIFTLLLGSLTLLIEANTWLILMLQCFVYTIVYITIMWIYGMNSYEKKLFSNELKKSVKVIKTIQKR